MKKLLAVMAVLAMTGAMAFADQHEGEAKKKAAAKTEQTKGKKAKKTDKHEENADNAEHHEGDGHAH